MINKGSEWRKWDLHIHSPKTKVNNNFTWTTEFINKIKSSEVKVFWITDYFSFNLDEFKLLKAIKWKIFFPNIEFRIDQKNKDWEFINIHVIFNNKDSIIDKIWDFLTRLNLLNEDNIEWTKYFCNDLWVKLGYDKCILKLDDLITKLKDNFNNNDYLIVGAPNWYWWFRPWSDTRWQEYAKWIDKISRFFLDSSETFAKSYKNQEFFLKEDRFLWAIKKPLIYCSDSHDEDMIWSKFTWIKADPTFEWLKQIIYEPEERVRIQKHKPADNFNKISEIELKFNNDVKIQQNWSLNSYDFCFSGVNKNLYLSDYFNCFIWWRWSWKSSLLNLIYCHITWNFNSDFLKNNKIINFNINDDIKVDYKWEIEFLWQNQIEIFATDYVEFSKAIYERLDNQDELKEESYKLEQYISSLDEYISNLEKIEKYKKDLLDLEKRLSNYQRIIDIVKSDEYSNITNDYDNSKQEYYNIEISKEKYSKTKIEFNSFLNNFSKIEDENNDFDKEYNILLDSLKEISDKLENNDFSEINSKQKKILEKWKEEKNKLENYLKEKWITEEKLKNLTEAQEWVHKWKNEQEEIKNELQKYSELQKELNIDEWRQLNNWYKDIIEKWLKKAEDELNQINNINIKSFNFNVVYNKNKAKEDLFEDFMTTFNKYQEWRYNTTTISETLFKIEIDEIINWKINWEWFSDIIKQLWNWKGNDFLKNIFENEYNFEIYKILIAKYLYNLNNYLKIEILYDNRPIEISSFWQKCTVVILIMLLFWNKPIIIDEPEAHLDSSLIANYLVDLIKQRKEQRQIIFATHNANFVINWDAEQIYILENIDNKTNFTQTSIENLKNRPKLLNLEWWEDAFWLRWKKYKS